MTKDFKDCLKKGKIKKFSRGKSLAGKELRLAKEVKEQKGVRNLFNGFSPSRERQEELKLRAALTKWQPFYLRVSLFCWGE